MSLSDWSNPVGRPRRFLSKKVGLGDEVSFWLRDEKGDIVASFTGVVLAVKAGSISLYNQKLHTSAYLQHSGSADVLPPSSNTGAGFTSLL